MYKFNCSTSSLGSVPTFTEEDIRAEPMLYGFSLYKALEDGGVITQTILSKILGDVNREIGEMACLGYHPVIDTKSVLLMEGQAPCIPGWHCDGVIREARGSQPDLSTLGEPIKHYVCTLTGEGGIHSGITIPQQDEILIHPDVVNKESVWGSINDEINRKAIPIHESGNGEIVKFNRSCLHKGGVARGRCWRYFFRLSFYHMPALNEIRNQVQVYTDFNKGW